jgi:hypothetical protein
VILDGFAHQFGDTGRGKSRLQAQTGCMPRKTDANASA